MRTRAIFTILLYIFCINGLNAQKNNKKITITGTVLDVSKSPIVNAIILIDGQSTNTVTDSDGKYKVRVNPNALEIGVITFGNGIIVDSINRRTRIDFSFSTITGKVSDSDPLPGEEAVDVGYNYIKKKDLTNSVGIFDAKNSKKTYNSVYEMIKEIPGINAKVFNLFGPVGPVYILNGMEVNSLDGILPSTVESIVFLRDASAAIYGTRAFGGVILIKTKIGN